MLNCYYQNVRGLNTKTLNFSKNVLCNNYDIIVLTETWIQSGVTDRELFDDRYNVYRCDRDTDRRGSKKTGGGVLIAIKTKFNSYKICQNNGNSIEDLWVILDHIDGKESKKICICAVYVSPPLKRDDYELFLQSAGTLMLDSSDSYDCLIMGDFNLSCVDWSSGVDDSSVLVPSGSGHLYTSLTEFMALHNLHQFNSVTNNNNKVLDLVLSNIGKILVSLSDDSLSTVDPQHPPLEVEVRLTTETT